MFCTRFEDLDFEAKVRVRSVSNADVSALKKLLRYCGNVNLTFELAMNFTLSIVPLNLNRI